MDKFNRRPTLKARRRKFGLVLLAFLVPATAFVLLFALGNTVAPWVLGAYAAALVLGAVLSFRSAMRARAVWVQQWPIQPEQGPGFTTLELSALSEIFGSDPSNATLNRYEQVESRINTGSGCITTILRGSNRPVVGSTAPAYFRLSSSSLIVGARHWLVDDQYDQLEFFTGGEDTTNLDWGRVSFDTIHDQHFPQPPDSPPTAAMPWFPRFTPPA